MVQINFAQKSVTVKIVYYGPGMSGKTTNLEVIHQRAPDKSRGELTSISTDGDRTLFFDFMPLDLGTVAGMRTQFQIYTVPGQVYYNSTRKLVLQGVDGVIFVADSSASMVEENLESMANLVENLADYGKDISEMPMVIQYNKRDLPDALTVEELNASLNPSGAPTIEGVASSGQGVFPTLKTLAALVLDTVHRASGAASAPLVTESAVPTPKPSRPSVSTANSMGSPVESPVLSKAPTMESVSGPQSIVSESPVREAPPLDSGSGDSPMPNPLRMSPSGPVPEPASSSPRIAAEHTGAGEREKSPSMPMGMAPKPLVAPEQKMSAPMGQVPVEREAMGSVQEGQPSMQQPSKEQPSMQQPSMQQPSMQQPSMQQPSMQQPSMQQPSMQQPSMQQPSKEQPEMDEAPTASLRMASPMQMEDSPAAQAGAQESGPGLALEFEPLERPVESAPVSHHSKLMRVPADQATPAPAPRRAVNMNPPTRIRPRAQVAITPVQRSNKKAVTIAVACIAAAMGAGMLLGGLLFQSI